MVAREDNETSEIEAQEAVAFAISQFFFGARWLRATDNYAYRDFMGLLQLQAK